jgi:hypothetical protein
MKADAYTTLGKASMKRLQLVPLVLGLFLTSATGVIYAQGTGDQMGASKSRAEVKMDRDEFLKTHRWDSLEDNWVMMSEYEAPAGVKSRAEITAARDEFMRNNRWDETRSAWVSLKGKPRDLSTMTREQVRAETKNFVRTHQWDEVTGTWAEKMPNKMK